jgi:hypothetical protein
MSMMPPKPIVRIAGISGGEIVKDNAAMTCETASRSAKSY